MKKAIFLMLILCLLCSFAFAETAERPGFLRIENGMLQPVLSWTDLQDEDYTNEGSDILRFCVWVETDYDTDLDGKADLVKLYHTRVCCRGCLRHRHLRIRRL